MVSTELLIKAKMEGIRRAQAELRELRREAEAVTGETTKGGKAAEEAEEKHGSLLGSVANGAKFVAGLASAYGGYELVKGVVEGGIAANEQHLLLKSTLKNTGQAGSAAYKQINASIKENASHGGFGALEETKGISQLTAETKNYTTALKANQAVLSLARGTGQSYETSLTQIQKVEAGTPGRLTKIAGAYVPVTYWVDKLSKSERERFPERLKDAEYKDKEATSIQFLGRLREAEAGKLKAYNESTAGSISNAKNAFKEAEEELGEKLAPTIKEAAKAFSSLITEATKGEGIFKTIKEDAEALWEALKSVWTFFEKNNTALKILEKVLIAGGLLLALEKVYTIYKGISELNVVKGISRLVGGASAEYAEAGTTLGGVFGAAFDVAMVAAVALAIVEAEKKLRPPEKFGGEEKLHPKHPGEKQNFWELTTGDLNPGINEKEELAALRHGYNRATPEEIGAGIGPYGVTGNVSAGGTTKIDLHMDSQKVAEAVMRNPKASKKMAEAVNKATLAKVARG